MLTETLRRISIGPQFGTDDYRLWLEQSDFLAFLEANKTEEEVVLYAGTSAFIHCILVPLKAIDPLDVTDLMGWSCNPTSSWGISYTYLRTRKRPKVWISPPLDGCGSKTLAKGEQLLFLRQFDGRYEDQSYFEVSQKLTHAHDLHYVPERKAYCRFDDNGDIEDIIRITTFGESRFDHGGTIVTIKRDVLDLYLALTNSALVQLFDSIRHSPANFGGWGQHPEKIVEAWDKQLFYRVGMQPDNASYFRGFQILTMNQPHEKLLRQAAEWNDNTEKQYATFIAHDWRHGVVQELSCDPQHLANYFVKSDLPFEVTPAFFKPEVLLKYKSDPSKYELGYRSITRRHAWHLKTYDINDEGQVHTYLVYLSHLPYQEQLYWKSFNEPPKAPISKRAYTTDFLGQFYDVPDPLWGLKANLDKLLKEKAPWWRLRDSELIQRLHYPVTDSPEEWASELLILDQLLFEGLERSYFKTKAESLACAVDHKWNAPRFIKEILVTAGVDPNEVDAIVNPLQELHELRNKMKGHASGQEAKKIRVRLIKDHGSLKKHFIALVEHCDHAVGLIRDMAQNGVL